MGVCISWGSNLGSNPWTNGLLLGVAAIAQLMDYVSHPNRKYHPEFGVIFSEKPTPVFRGFVAIKVGTVGFIGDYQSKLVVEWDVVHNSSKKFQNNSQKKIRREECLLP